MPAVANYLLPALATILWGANFNLAGHVLAEVDAMTAAAARFDIAAAVLLVICLVRREAVPLFRHGRAYFTLGFVGITAFNVLFFIGMQSTSAVNGALIMAANPVLTAGIAFLLSGTVLRRRQWFALPIAFAGVAFVVLGGGAHLQVARGDLLILAGSVCWALYNVLVARLMPRKVGGLANTTGVMTAGAIILSVVAAATGAPVHDVHDVHAGALVALLLMALGGSVLAYLFWNAGIARLGAPRAALFMNLVPVSAMVIAALEGQPPTWVQQVGGATVILAVILASWPGRASLPVPVQTLRGVAPPPREHAACP